MSRPEQATLDFRRVLAAANGGEQARVAALVALSQRNVIVATWPGPHQAARTLTNSHSESALPLFTSVDALAPTATRFGWRHPDGSLQYRELPARDALRHALARAVHFVVIDIGFEHSVEFAREEIEPLLSAQAGTAGVPSALSVPQQPEAAILEAVRRTKPPRAPLSAAQPQPRTRTPSGALVAPDAELTTAASPLAAARVRTPLPGDRRGLTAPLAGAGDASVPVQPGVTSPASTSAGQPDTRPLTFAATQAQVTGADATLEGGEAETPANDVVGNELSDTMLQALCAGLRAFPEVEWACVLSDGSDTPQIALRIDPSFLNRVADITDVVLEVGEQESRVLQVLLLNNQDLVKNARKSGRAFYPWRR